MQPENQTPAPTPPPPSIGALDVAQSIPFNLAASAVIGLLAGWAAGKLIPCRKGV